MEEVYAEMYFMFFIVLLIKPDWEKSGGQAKFSRGYSQDSPL